MREQCVKLIALLMVIILPMSIMMADEATGMLTVVGDVKLNGVDVSQPTAVFPGDRVTTTPDSVAMLSMHGASVTVPADSVLVLADNEFDIACGGAMVNTVKGVSARVNNITVAPAGDSAKFEIVPDHDQTRIIAREGALAVNGGNFSTLQPGGMFAVPASNCAAAYRSPQGGPPRPAGRNVGGAVLLGLAAAIALFFLVCETTKSNTLSPSGFCS